MVKLLVSFAHESALKYTHDKVSFNDFEEFKINGTGSLRVPHLGIEKFAAIVKA